MDCGTLDLDALKTAYRAEYWSIYPNVRNRDSRQVREQRTIDAMRQESTLSDKYHDIVWRVIHECDESHSEFIDLLRGQPLEQYN